MEGLPFATVEPMPWGALSDADRSARPPIRVGRPGGRPLGAPCRVLLVEDDEVVRLGLEDSLCIAGYDVESTEGGEEALRLASNGGLDIILLDLILPDRDGLEVCAELRAKGIDTPVLMLTAKEGLDNVLRGFSAGADDYLVKPFDVMELIARIRAVLGRTRKSARVEQMQKYPAGDSRWDLEKGVVLRARERVALSAKELALLQYFVTHPAEPLSREQLHREVWHAQSRQPSRTVDLHVATLRRKIEEDPRRPRWIRTVRGIGYEFVVE